MISLYYTANSELLYVFTIRRIPNTITVPGIVAATRHGQRRELNVRGNSELLLRLRLLRLDARRRAAGGASPSVLALTVSRRGMLEAALVITTDAPPPPPPPCRCAYWSRRLSSLKRRTRRCRASGGAERRRTSAPTRTSDQRSAAPRLAVGIPRREVTSCARALLDFCVQG